MIEAFQLNIANFVCKSFCMNVHIRETIADAESEGLGRKGVSDHISHIARSNGFEAQFYASVDFGKLVGFIEANS